MKMIAAVVQPFMLSKLTQALEEIDGFPGMTVLNAQGFGREKAAQYGDQGPRRIDDFVDFVKKVRVEIVARDHMVERIVATISSTAHTGNQGDGKIFVWTVEHAVRIKTGEEGDAAI